MVVGPENTLVEGIHDYFQEKDETVRLVARDASGAWIPDEGYVRLLNDDGRRTASDFSGDWASDLVWRHWNDGRNTIWRSANGTL